MFSNFFSGFRRGRSGFFIDGKFYDNKGLGHTTNARQIIQSNKKWNQEWTEKGGDEQDFLVKKGAIQIGSGIDQEIVIVDKKHFKNERKLEKFKKEHDIEDYKNHIIKFKD